VALRNKEVEMGSSAKKGMSVQKRAREQRLRERRELKRERKAARRDDATSTGTGEPNEQDSGDLGGRERQEQIAAALADRGLQLSYAHGYGGNSWVAVVQDDAAGTTTRYQPGATRLESAENAWRAISG